MSKRFDNIDQLRGIAALSVMIGHLSAITMRTNGSAHVDASLLTGLEFLSKDNGNLGRVGVIVFFLISGYLVPFGFSGARPVRDFIVGRVFRLYPLFWFSLLAVVLLGACLGTTTLPLRLLANLTMVPDFIGSERILDVYWTLGIEIVFYAIVLGLFVAAGPIGFPVAAGSSAACMLACMAISGLQAGGVNVPLADKIFLIGTMFLGTSWRLIGRQAGRGAWAAGLIGLFGIATLGRGYIHFVLFLYGPSHEFIDFRGHLISDGVALAIFLAGASTRAAWGPLVRIGLVSYSLYILHPILMIASDGFGWTRPLVGLQLYIPALALGSLALSALTYRFVEAPAIALGRRLRGASARRQDVPSDIPAAVPSASAG